MRQVLLLRGINLGPRRRIPMVALRGLLDGAAHGPVVTYLQSGNVVLSSDLDPRGLEQRCAELISGHFGFPVPVIARTRDELAGVVARDPLGAQASEPKRYQVSFLSGGLAAEQVTALQALAAPGERLVVIGREAYAWHPDGVARSKLSSRLASPRLGVTATARNWTTVTALLKLADAL